MGAEASTPIGRRSHIKRKQTNNILLACVCSWRTHVSTARVRRAQALQCSASDEAGAPEPRGPTRGPSRSPASTGSPPPPLPLSAQRLHHPPPRFRRLCPHRPVPLAISRSPAQPAPCHQRTADSPADSRQSALCPHRPLPLAISRSAASGQSSGGQRASPQARRPGPCSQLLRGRADSGLLSPCRARSPSTPPLPSSPPRIHRRSALRQPQRPSAVPPGLLRVPPRDSGQAQVLRAMVVPPLPPRRCRRPLGGQPAGAAVPMRPVHHCHWSPRAAASAKG